MKGKRESQLKSKDYVEPSPNMTEHLHTFLPASETMRPSLSSKVLQARRTAPEPTRTPPLDARPERIAGVPQIRIIAPENTTAETGRLKSPPSSPVLKTPQKSPKSSPRS